MTAKWHQLSGSLRVFYAGYVTHISDSGSGRREINLDDEEMKALFQWYFDGRCPVCGVDINEGEVVCDDCFKRAERYRVFGPDLPNTGVRET